MVHWAAEEARSRAILRQQLSCCVLPALWRALDAVLLDGAFASGSAACELTKALLSFGGVSGGSLPLWLRRSPPVQLPFASRRQLLLSPQWPALLFLGDHPCLLLVACEPQPVTQWTQSLGTVSALDYGICCALLASNTDRSVHTRPVQGRSRDPDQPDLLRQKTRRSQQSQLGIAGAGSLWLSSAAALTASAGV